MAAYGTMGNCSAALSATYSVTETPPVGFSSATISQSDTSQILFTAGTSGAKAIDQHFELGSAGSPYGLAVASPLTLTLSDLGGSRRDGLKREAGFGHITGLWIRLTNPNSARYITLAQGATNPFILLEGSGGVIRINSFFMWSDDTGGLAVAAGSADKILLTAVGSTCNILLGIIGTTG